jgi:16S rRNA G966 N2-methylase RsmD
MSDYYQVFFRTKKGGKGIDYETAKAEFISVFRAYKVVLIRELPFKMRIHVEIHNISDDEVANLAKNLGYTYGILHAHEEAYLGEKLEARNTARWVVGSIRLGDRKLHLTEIYRQDENDIIKSAPHQRTFLVDKDGEVKSAKGHRRKRGVSPNDAKFILNISELNGNEIIFDPFGGIGGLLLESRARGFKIFASDIDPVVRPGLASVTDNHCVLADARNLPFRNTFFDVIITEPPFGTKYRQNVIDSISELCRVTKPTGKIVLLIAQDMFDAIVSCMQDYNFGMTKDFLIRRHGGLISHVLMFQK